MNRKCHSFKAKMVKEKPNIHLFTQISIQEKSYCTQRIHKDSVWRQREVWGVRVDAESKGKSVDTSCRGSQHQYSVTESRRLQTGNAGKNLKWWSGSGGGVFFHPQCLLGEKSRRDDDDAAAAAAAERQILTNKMKKMFPPGIESPPQTETERCPNTILLRAREQNPV